MSMGQVAGMCTSATLAGAFTRQQADAMNAPPDFVVESLLELLDLTD
jgi:hypothetical protein